MHKRNADHENNYFKELTRNLHREEFEVSAGENDFLLVKLDGQQLCQITSNGGVRYRQEDITDDRMSKAMDRVTRITRITYEYVSKLEAVPAPKVIGSGGDYRLLAGFNRIILAGCQTKYGAQFITWERSPNRASLNNGHYFGPGGADSYTAAKQDFAIRSGMVPSSAIFTTDQLVEVYRNAQEALESNFTLTVGRENLLQDVIEKIQDCVPNVDELVHQLEEQESNPGMEQSW